MQRFRKGQQFKPPSAAEHAAHADAAAAHRRAPSQPQDLAPVGQAVFVLTPEDGIDARDGTTVSSAVCTRLVETLGASGALELVQTDEQYRVYNFAEAAIAGSTQIETGLTSCGTRHSLSVGGVGQLAKSTVVIPARIGSIPGSATVTLQKLEGGLLVDDGDPITVYSWVRQDSQTPAPSFYLFVSQDKYGTWWFTGEDCPQ